MKLIHDARPYRTFTIQISFNAGWRHEPIKLRGMMRKSLEELMKSVSFRLPNWFELEYVMDAEFSSILIFGLTSDQQSLRKVPDVLEMDFPQIYSDLGASFEMVVSSGGIKKEIVKDFEILRSAKTAPKIVSKPRRFLARKDISRVLKHFLVYLFQRENYDVFLEVSKRGDRVHYGKNVGDLEISVEEAKKHYIAWMLKRWESTKESSKLLTLMNVFSEKITMIDDILHDLKNYEVVSEVIEILKKASKS